MTTKPKQSLSGLLIAQFTGAFNDNAWKLMVFTLASRTLTEQIHHGEAELTSASQYQATLSFLVFLIPFLIFSVPAGLIADLYSKKTLIVAMKILEVALMSAAAFVLWIMPGHLVLPFCVLALMGLHSALFGPAKYGILPEILAPEKLSKGNGLLEMWSMLAIILGTGLGPLFLAPDAGGSKPWLTWLGPCFLAILAFIGLLAAWRIPPVKPAKQQRTGVIKTLKQAWQTIYRDRPLWLAVIGCIVYWSITSLIGQNVLVYAKSLVIDLERGELWQGMAPASYGVGIAFGALLAGKLSGDRIEYGLIPLGALGFAFMSLLLGILEPGMVGTVCILMITGGSAGLLIVPLHATIQSRSPLEQRGTIIAMGNILDILGMIAGSLLAAGMAFIGLDLQSTLIFSALFVVGGMVWAIRLLPDALVRLGFIVLTKTFYQIRTLGLERIPPAKPFALYKNDRPSFLDALFITALIDRPIRMVITKDYYERWYVKPFAKLMRAVPVSNSQELKDALIKLQNYEKEIDIDPILCILPDKPINPTLFISENWKYPVIPLKMEYVKTSFLGENWDYYLAKLSQMAPYKATVTFEES